MRKNSLFFNVTSLVIAVAFMVSLASCGTLLYPERRGQTGGRIDAGVAVMDGIGLLLFIVPGVIAFVVDFSTGAIYLPSSSSQLDLDPSDIQHARVLQGDSAPLTLAEIEARVERHVGQDIDLHSPETKVARFSSQRGMVYGSISKVLTPDQFAAVEEEDGAGRG
jgi:hypothetical protein